MHRQQPHRRSSKIGKREITKQILYTTEKRKTPTPLRSHPITPELFNYTLKIIRIYHVVDTKLNPNVDITHSQTQGMKHGATLPVLAPAHSAPAPAAVAVTAAAAAEFEPPPVPLPPPPPASDAAPSPAVSPSSSPYSPHPPLLPPSSYSYSVMHLVAEVAAGASTSEP